MRYVDINPDEAVAAVRTMFPTQVAKARMMVQTEIARQWREHQSEIAKTIPYYSDGDDGTEPQCDGMTLQHALMALFYRAGKHGGKL